MNLTDLFIEGLMARAQSVPERVMVRSRGVLIDYLGAMVGGMRFLEDRHPELVKAAQSDAFIHGFAAHVLELDDGHRHGMIHLGASIISAILEMAEKESLSSDAVLSGLVMGYEAAVRCARALQPGHKVRGYHVSGTCGTIGSAIGIAVACEYNKAQIKSTLACAVSSAAGVLEIQEQASELKPYNVGRAAFDGVLSAQVGRLGLHGPDDILGGKLGFLAALTDTPKTEFLSDFSGEGYCIEGIYQKIHAACRHAHPAIDATLDICAHVGLTATQVERIEVHTYRLAVESHDHADIRGISSAKLSTPFGVSLAIAKGRAGYADYCEENLHDKLIEDLTQKVKVFDDAEFTQMSPAVRGAKVEVLLKDGRSFEASCHYPKGEPENPLTKEELENKFRGLAMYGGLSSEVCDEVIDSISKSKFDINKLMQIVCKK